MVPISEQQIPSQLPKTRRKPGLRSMESSTSTSKIPVKNRQVSTPVELLDDSSLGSVKKSSIPRITSSPLFLSASSRKGLTPIINKDLSVSTPASKTTLLNNQTPPSTISKLTNQLSELSLESPSKIRHAAKESTSPAVQKGHHTPTYGKMRANMDQNEVKRNITPIKVRSVSTSETSTSPHLTNRTSLLLKKRLQNQSGSASPLKNVSSVEPKVLKSTRSVSLNNLAKRRSTHENTMMPLKEHTSTKDPRHTTELDNSPLFTRLTRSTASSDLKSNARIPRSSTVSNLHNPKVRSVSNNTLGSASIGYSRYPTSTLPSHKSSIPKQPKTIQENASPETSTTILRPHRIEKSNPSSNLNSSIVMPKRRANFTKSFSVNTNLSQLPKEPEQLAKSNRIVSSRRQPPLERRTVSNNALRPVNSSGVAVELQSGPLRNIRDLKSCLFAFEKTKHILKPEDHTKIIQCKRASMIDFNSLTSYEKAELSKMDKVYYVGTKRHKSQSKNDFRRNFGFDDADKNLILEIGDHINYRYQIIGHLGKGSFGNVMRCFDHKMGSEVSIKIMKNDITWSLQCINEIKVLKKMRNQNCLKYFGHFNFRSHICISTELLAVNLYDALEATKFRAFDLKVIKKWSSDLLSGLHSIHSAGIVHADIKPENIMLVSPNSLDVKIIDFGSSSPIGEISYPYIQSRFYRAPEISLGCRYNEKIDIWSFAVMMYELHTGNPLFGARDENHLLKLIASAIGPPSPETVLLLRAELNKYGSVCKGKTMKYVDHKACIFTRFDPNGIFLGFPNNEDTPVKSSSIKSSFTEDPQFDNFLHSALVWNYTERASAKSLLNHEFLL